ncbi:MAG: T9SS type A sorting domain-containing protein [Ignavibacteria bacterium]|nr:T9SS type A sorting domain-containing protein [Ignavibacteria bacterium]
MLKLTAPFIFLFLSTVVSVSQWQPDLRLTSDVTSSDLSSSWNIASSGSYIHIVWEDFESIFLNNKLLYKRSSDGGITWNSNIEFTTRTWQIHYPAIACVGSDVHIVWSDYRDNNYEIYYKHSSNNGTSWGPDTRLTNNTFSGLNVSIAAVSPSGIHVVWSEAHDANNYELHYTRSTDGGLNWQNEVRLTNAPDRSQSPSIAALGLSVYIVWVDKRNGTEDIYFKLSSDAGLNWSNDMELRNDTVNCFDPAIAVSGANVYVTWNNFRNDDFRVIFNRSTNGGMNWGTETNITSDTVSSSGPSITASDSSVHLVWHNSLAGHSEVHYKLSTNIGSSWLPDMRFTTNSSLNASVNVSGSAVYTIWEDFRDGNREIYYKRNPTGSPLGVEIVNSVLPTSYLLKQNYPNPFNPVTNINFSIPKAEFVNISVFDILGRKINSLVDEWLNAGVYETDWDASAFPSGVYYYKFTAGDFSETRKMILIK